MTLSFREQIVQLYVATFNRAPDATGLNYWENDSGLTIEGIAQSFFDQEETQNKYPNIDDNLDNFVDGIYWNMFGRHAEQDGLDYWVEQLETGAVSKGNMILAIANGAQDTELGQDATILENKTEVGLVYADSSMEGTDFSVSQITEYAESVEKAINEITGGTDNVFTLVKNISQTEASVNVSVEVIEGEDGHTVIKWGDPDCADCNIDADAFFGDGGYLEQLLGADFAELGLIDIGANTKLTSVNLAVVDTAAIDADTASVVLTYDTATGEQFTTELELGKEYLAFLDGVLFYTDPATGAKISRFTSVQEGATEDQTVTTTTYTYNYTLTPIVLTSTENNGGTLLEGTTTEGNDLIVAGQTELLHGAYIDAAGGYNTLEVDLKGVYAQPLGLINIQEIDVQNLPNVYDDYYDLGQYQIITDSLGNTTIVNTTNDQNADGLEIPDYLEDGIGHPLHSTLDLSRAVDLEKLVVTEGHGTTVGDHGDSSSLGGMTIVGIRNGAKTYIEGSFTQPVFLHYGEGLTGAVDLVLNLGDMSDNAELSIAHNSGSINIEAMGDANNIEGNFGGNLGLMTVTGQGSVSIDSNLANSFDAFRPSVIDATSNEGGFSGWMIGGFAGLNDMIPVVGPMLGDAPMVEVDFRGSHGTDVFLSGVAGRTSLVGNEGNDILASVISTTTTIDGGTGDNFMLSAGSAFSNIAAAEGNDTVIALANIELNIDAGNGDNLIITGENIATDIKTGDGDDQIIAHAAILPDLGLIPTDLYDGLSDLLGGITGENGAILYFNGSALAEMPTGTRAVTIDAGNGNNEIHTSADEITVVTGEGDDQIEAAATVSVSITAGNGNNEIIANDSELATITTGSGNDMISATGTTASVTIEAGEGNNVINTTGSSVVTVTTGNGDDTIISGNTDVATVNAGDGSNTINIGAGELTLTTGSGDDHVTISGQRVVLDSHFDPIGNDIIGSDVNYSASANRYALVNIDLGAGENTLVIGRDINTDPFADIGLVALQGSSITGENITMSIENAADLRQVDMTSANITSVILRNTKLSDDMDGTNPDYNPAYNGEVTLKLTAEQFAAIGTDAFSVENDAFGAEAVLEIVITEDTVLSELVDLATLDTDINLKFVVADGATLTLTAEELHTHVAVNGISMDDDNGYIDNQVVITDAGSEFDPFNQENGGSQGGTLDDSVGLNDISIIRTLDGYERPAETAYSNAMYIDSDETPVVGDVHSPMTDALIITGESDLEFTGTIHFEDNFNFTIDFSELNGLATGMTIDNFDAITAANLTADPDDTTVGQIIGNGLDGTRIDVHLDGDVGSRTVAEANAQATETEDETDNGLLSSGVSTYVVTEIAGTANFDFYVCDNTQDLEVLGLQGNYDGEISFMQVQHGVEFLMEGDGGATYSLKANGHPSYSNVGTLNAEFRWDNAPAVVNVNNQGVSTDRPIHVEGINIDNAKSITVNGEDADIIIESLEGNQVSELVFASANDITVQIDEGSDVDTLTSINASDVDGTFSYEITAVDTYDMHQVQIAGIDKIVFTQDSVTFADPASAAELDLNIDQVDAIGAANIVVDVDYSDDLCDLCLDGHAPQPILDICNLDDRLFNSTAFDTDLVLNVSMAAGEWTIDAATDFTAVDEFTIVEGATVNMTAEQLLQLADATIVAEPCDNTDDMPTLNVSGVTQDLLDAGLDVIIAGLYNMGFAGTVEIVDDVNLDGSVLNTFTGDNAIRLIGNNDADLRVNVNMDVTPVGVDPENGIQSEGIPTFVVTGFDLNNDDTNDSDTTATFYVCNDTQDLVTLGLQENATNTIVFEGVKRGVEFLLEGDGAASWEDVEKIDMTTPDVSNIGSLIGTFYTDHADAVVNINNAGTTLTDSSDGGERSIYVDGVTINNADSITINVTDGDAIIGQVLTGTLDSQGNATGAADSLILNAVEDLTIDNAQTLTGLDSIDASGVVDTMTLAITADADFSNVALTDIDVITIADTFINEYNGLIEVPTQLTLNADQVVAIGEANIMGLDEAGDIVNEELNITNLSDQVINANLLGREVDLGDVTMASGNNVLNADLTGANSIIIPEGGSLTLTADQYMALDNGTITILDTNGNIVDDTANVTITGLTQAHIDAGFSLVNIGNGIVGSVTMAEDITLEGLDQNNTATFGVDTEWDHDMAIIMSDDQTLKIANSVQADGLDIIGGDNTTAIYQFIVLNQADGQIDASGYEITTLKAIDLFFNNRQDSENAEFVIQNLDGSVALHVYDSTEFGYVTSVVRNVVIEEGAELPGHFVFNDVQEDKEIIILNLDMLGDASITSDLRIPTMAVTAPNYVANADGLIASYFETLNINSTGDTANSIGGAITAEANDPSITSIWDPNGTDPVGTVEVENNLLDVNITADQDLSIDQIIFSSRTDEATATVDVDVAAGTTVTINDLDTSDHVLNPNDPTDANEVDALIVTHTGDGNLTVGLSSEATVDAEDMITINGSENADAIMTLVITGDLDLSGDILNNVDQIILKDGANLTLTQAQIAAVGMANIVMEDPENDTATLNVVELGNDPFHASNLTEGVMLGDVTIDAGETVILDGNLIGITGEIIVPDDSTFNMTVAQYIETELADVVAQDADNDAATNGTVNLTDMTQADEGDAFSAPLTFANIDNALQGTLTLAEDVILDVDTNLDMIAIELADGQTIQLSVDAQADGREITGGDDTTVRLGFDTAGTNALINAENYNFAELFVLDLLVENINNNIEELLPNLDSAINVNIFEADETIPAGATPTLRTVTIVEGTEVDAVTIFNDLADDAEVTHLTITMEGDATITDGINIDTVAPGQDIVFSYFKELNIISEGDQANTIGGSINANGLSGETGATENNLLDVNILATQDLAINIIEFSAILDSDDDTANGGIDGPNELATLNVDVAADVTVTIADLNTDDDDVDSLTVNHIGDGDLIVGLSSLATIDATDLITINGSENPDAVMTLVIDGDIDLSDDILNNVDQIILKDGANLTLTQAQIDAVGIANIVVEDADNDNAVLNVVDLGEDRFNATELTEGVALGTVTIVADAEVTLHDETNLTGVDSITVSDETTLNMTAAQFIEIGTAEIISADDVSNDPVDTYGTVNITNMTQADEDAETALTFANIQQELQGTITLEDAMVVLDSDTALSFMSIELGEGQTIQLSNHAQADDLVITTAPGATNTELVLFFVGAQTSINAEGYDIDKLSVFDQLIDGAAGNTNVEELLAGLASEVPVFVFDETTDFVPADGAMLIDRVIHVEEGVSVDSDTIFQALAGAEVATLTINMEGDAIIEGNIGLDRTEEVSYFETLTINSYGTGVNNIDGIITGAGDATNDDADENNILNVVVSAQEDINIGGVVFTALAVEKETATFDIAVNQDIVNGDTFALDVETVTFTGSENAVEAAEMIAAYDFTNWDVTSDGNTLTITAKVAGDLDSVPDNETLASLVTTLDGVQVVTNQGESNNETATFAADVDAGKTVVVGDLGTSDDDVDFLVVNHTGDGALTVGLSSNNTIDATDGITINGSVNPDAVMTLVIDGVIDLSDDTLNEVDAVILTETTQLTVKTSQLLEIGEANFDTTTTPEDTDLASMVINNYNGEEIDLGAIDEDITIDQLVLREDAGVIDLHENMTDLSNVLEIVIPEGTTLNMTADQFESLAGAGTITGEGTLNITAFDSDNGDSINFSDLGADLIHGTVTLDADESLVLVTGDAVLDVTINDYGTADEEEVGFDFIMSAEGQMLTFSTDTQVDGRVVLSGDLLDTTLQLGFLTGESTSAAGANMVEASGFDVTDLIVLDEYVSNVAAALNASNPTYNFENSLNDLPGDVHIIVKDYVEGDETLDPDAVASTHRVATVEENATVDAHALFNDLDEGVAVASLNLTMNGNATITGNLGFPTITVDPAEYTQVYFNTLVINSISDNGEANAINGQINAGVEGAASENNLLDITINANEDLTIDGGIVFSALQDGSVAQIVANVNTGVTVDAGNLGTDDEEVDGLTVIHNGTGTFIFELSSTATIDASDMMTIIGSEFGTTIMEIAGIIDLTDNGDSIVNVNEIVFTADDSILTITEADFHDIQDADGFVSPVAVNTAKLVINDYDGGAFDSQTNLDDVVISTLNVQDTNAVVVVDGAADFSNVGSIFIPEGTTLEMTADVFETLNSGVIYGSGTLNLTEFDSDNGVAIDLSHVTALRGTIELRDTAADVDNVVLVTLGATLDETVDGFEFIMAADGQILTLSSETQSDGRAVTASGHTDTMLMLGFDSADNVTDNDAVIDAVDFDVATVRLLDTYVANEATGASFNFEEIMLNLDPLVTLNVYHVIEGDIGVGIDPHAVNSYDRTVVVEADTTVLPHAVFNNLSETEEVRNLDLTMSGGSVIEGVLSLPTNISFSNNPLLFNTLTITSEGDSPNRIDGIDAGAEGDYRENNLLDVDITATQDLTIGDLEFSSRAVRESFELDLTVGFEVSDGGVVRFLFDGEEVVLAPVGSDMDRLAAADAIAGGTYTNWDTSYDSVSGLVTFTANADGDKTDITADDIVFDVMSDGTNIGANVENYIQGFGVTDAHATVDVDVAAGDKVTIVDIDSDDDDVDSVAITHTGEGAFEFGLSSLATIDASDVLTIVGSADGVTIMSISGEIDLTDNGDSVENVDTVHLIEDPATATDTTLTILGEDFVEVQNSTRGDGFTTDALPSDKSHLIIEDYAESDLNTTNRVSENISIDKLTLRGDLGDVTTTDISNIHWLEIPAGTNVIMSAEEANNLDHIIGDGTVTITDLEADVDGLLAGEIDDNGIHTGADLSNIDAAITINATLDSTDDVEFDIGNFAHATVTVTGTGTADITSVTAGSSTYAIQAAATLLLSASQADGRTTSGAGTTYVEDLDNDAAADLTGLGSDTVTIDVLNDTTFTGTLSPVATTTVNVADTETLTVEANIVDGYTVAGAGTVYISATPAAEDTDLDSFTVANITFDPADVIGTIDFPSLDNQTVKMTAAQADEQTIVETANGTVIVTSLGAGKTDLSAIAATTLTAYVPSDAELDTATNLGDFEVVLRDDVDLTLTAGQLAATINSLGNFFGTEFAGANDETLIVNDYNGEDFAQLGNEFVEIAQLNIKPGTDVTLGTIADLGDISGIYIPNDSSLTMTVDQYVELGKIYTNIGAGTGQGTLNLTGLTQAHIDAGLDLDVANPTHGTLTLADESGNPLFPMGWTLDPVDTILGDFAIDMPIDGMALTLSSDVQADGRVITGVADSGNGGTSVTLGFDSITIDGNDAGAVPPAAAPDTTLDASNYAFTHLWISQFLVENETSNIEDLVYGLRSDTDVTIFDATPGSTSPQPPSDIDDAANKTLRTVTIEADTEVTDDVAFIDTGIITDPAAVEVSKLTMNFSGNSGITGDVGLNADANPDPLHTYNYFNELTINSANNGAVGTTNYIDGYITGEGTHDVNNDDAENDLLLVNINATEDMTIGGIRFSSRVETEEFTFDLDDNMLISDDSVNGGAAFTFDGITVLLGTLNGASGNGAWAQANKIMTEFTANPLSNWTVTQIGDVLTFRSKTDGKLTTHVTGSDFVFQAFNNESENLTGGLDITTWGRGDTAAEAVLNVDVAAGKTVIIGEIDTDEDGDITIATGNDDVDSFVLNHTGAGAVNILLSTLDSVDNGDVITINGSTDDVAAMTTITVRSDSGSPLNLSDDHLNHVDAIEVQEGGSLILAWDQVDDSDGDGVGIENIRTIDDSGTFPESITIVDYNNDAGGIDATVLTGNGFENVILQLSENAGEIFIDGTSDLTGISEIIVPDGTVLNLTVEQFQQLNGNGTISGAGTVNLLNPTQADIDAGLDLTDVTAQKGYIHFDTDIALKTSTDLGEVDGNGDGVKDGFQLFLDDNLEIVLSTQEQADGRVIYSVDTATSATIVLGFDQLGSQAYAYPYDKPTNTKLDMEDYTHITDIQVLDRLVEMYNNNNLGALLKNLSGETTIHIWEYNYDDHTTTNPADDWILDQSAFQSTHFVEVEAGVVVDGDVRYIEAKENIDPVTGDIITKALEIVELDLTFKGDSHITGELLLYSRNEEDYSFSYFETLNIHSESTSGFTGANSIEGGIKAITNNHGRENNLLNINIEAIEDLDINGPIVFTSRLETEVFVLDLDDTMNIVGSTDSIEFDGTTVPLSPNPTDDMNATQVASLLAAAGYSNWIATVDSNDSTRVIFTSKNPGVNENVQGSDFTFTDVTDINQDANTGFTGAVDTINEGGGTDSTAVLTVTGDQNVNLDQLNVWDDEVTTLRIVNENVGGIVTAAISDNDVSTTPIAPGIATNVEIDMVAGSVTDIDATLLNNFNSTFTVTGDGDLTIVSGALLQTFDLGGFDGTSDITGGGYRDTLIGGTGADTFNGQSGNDIIDGGEGDDHITGGAGDDTMTGGTGNDTFYIAFGGEGDDHIIDFTIGGSQDSIDFTGSSDVSGVSNPGAFKLLQPSGGNTTVMADSGMIGISNVNGYDADSLSTTDVAAYLHDFDLAGGGSGHLEFENPAANTDSFYLVVTDGTHSAVFEATSANSDATIDANELSLIVTLDGVSDLSSISANDFADFV